MPRPLAIALLLVVLAAPVSRASGEHAIPGHHIEATFGLAVHDGHTGSFSGLEYEYRFSQYFGVGAFGDTTFGGFDLAAFGVVVNYHPAGQWKLVGGLGVEQKLSNGQSKALFRLGLAYEFPVGNGIIAPTLAYDFLEDTKDVFYAGVGLGFAF